MDIRLFWELRAYGGLARSQTERRHHLPLGRGEKPIQLSEPARSAIAIDGPAGVGKTTVGQSLARRLGFRFLDTGLMYRAVTYVAITDELSVEDQEAIEALASRLKFQVTENDAGSSRILVNGEDVTDHLREVAVDSNVSAVSAMPGVRSVVVGEQRRIAAEGRIVMVGRDIGTVVLPDTPAKIYLTASPEVRAQRRFDENQAKGGGSSYSEILERMKKRDHIDSNRQDSPLKPADDAVVVDTGELSVDEVVERLLEISGGTGR